MKTLNTCLTVFFVVLSTSLFASGTIELVDQGNGIYKLFYDNDNDGEVKIKIYDEKGRVIRRDKIQNKIGFYKPYNFNSLASGTYKIEVVDDNGTTRKLVNLKNNQQEVAIMHVREGKYQLLLTDPANTSADITIYNQDYEIIHSEKIDFDYGFSKVFDLSGFEQGNFTFEVKSVKTFKRITI